MNEKNEEKRPLPESVKKKLTKQARDENIAIAEKRGQKPDKTPAKKRFTKEEIEKARKAKLIFEKEKPHFPLLKDMDEIPAEEDHYVVDLIRQTYLDESKNGETIKNAGDKKRTGLKFTHCNECPRVVYYEFHEPERSRDYTFKGLVFFDEGRKSHRNLQNRLEKADASRKSEGYFYLEEINATGLYDDILFIEKQGDYSLVDIVEIKDKFSGATKSVSQDNYDQAQLYFYAAEWSKWFEIKKYKPRAIRLLYKDRTLMTDDVLFGYIVKPDPERQTDIMNYMRFLWNEVAQKKVLVPHPYERKSTKCQYCRFHDHCWSGYPEVIKENEKEEELKTLELPPEQEIFDSYAKRAFEILKEEEKLKAEKEQVEKILLAYFIQTQNKVIPVTTSEGIGVRQSKNTEWDWAGLRDAIGHEYYARISKPNASLITDLIKREHIDAGKFEEFKKYKMSKPSIYLKKL